MEGQRDAEYMAPALESNTAACAARSSSELKCTLTKTTKHAREFAY